MVHDSTPSIGAGALTRAPGPTGAPGGNFGFFGARDLPVPAGGSSFFKSPFTFSSPMAALTYAKSLLGCPARKAS